MCDSQAGDQRVLTNAAHEVHFLGTARDPEKRAIPIAQSAPTTQIAGDLTPNQRKRTTKTQTQTARSRAVDFRNESRLGIRVGLLHAVTILVQSGLEVLNDSTALALRGSCCAQERLIPGRQQLELNMKRTATGLKIPGLPCVQFGCFVGCVIV